MKRKYSTIMRRVKSELVKMGLDEKVFVEALANAKTGGTKPVKFSRKQLAKLSELVSMPGSKAVIVNSVNKKTIQIFSLKSYESLVKCAASARKNIGKKRKKRAYVKSGKYTKKNLLLKK